MGSSESKPGPEGPKGDKGDKGDKGNPLIEIEVQKAAEQEMKKQTTRIAKEAALDARIEQEVQAARDAEAARRAEALATETQGFTNYSRGTDYSNISVDNGSYSFKQKLTGSPISF